MKVEGVLFGVYAVFLVFVGFHLTFLVQHWLGAEGMPRRYGDYYASDGFTTLNTVSSIGAFVLGASTLPFIYNVIVSFRRGQKAIRNRCRICTTNRISSRARWISNWKSCC